MAPESLIALGIIGLAFAYKQGWLTGFVNSQDSTDTDDTPLPGPSPAPIENVDLDKLRDEFLSARDAVRSAEERFIEATNRYESALIEADERVDKELAELRSEFRDKTAEPDKQPDETSDEKAPA